MEQPAWSWVSRRSKENHKWEEKAFTEDAERYFGAFSWPPRSYSCRFCSKEFGSAQALGGHMNIHRREKAGLNQSPHNKIINNHVQKYPCKSIGVGYPDQIFASTHKFSVKSQPKSSGVSTFSGVSLPPLHPIPFKIKRSVGLLACWTDPDSDIDGEKILLCPCLEIKKEDIYAESSSSPSLNKFLGPEELDSVHYKKRRIGNELSLASFHKPQNLAGFGVGAREGLDLELRLG